MALTSAPRPKVVFVNRYFHPDQSATSQLLTDLARVLAASGMDIHVICSRQLHDRPAARLPAIEALDGIVVHRAWTTRFGRDRIAGRALDYLTFYCSSTIAMLRLVGRGDTLVAETDPPLISIPAMAVAKFRGADLVNWLQDIFPEVASLLGANPLPRVIDATLCRCRNWSLRAARLNVVLGERMRERLAAAGMDAANIRVVQNWAEATPDPPKPPDRSALRAKLGLLDKFVVAYSGNLGRAHEFQTLLGAAEILRNDPEVVFLMIGGGAGMTPLTRAVSECGLTNFRFVPHQPRETLGDCLAAADVHWVSLLPELEGFIVPSKYYGILAAARPVMFIGDPDGELARDICESGGGAVVGVGESDRLARVLADWKSDPMGRELMGRCGYDRYRERFSAQRAFAQWRRILDP